MCGGLFYLMICLFRLKICQVNVFCWALSSSVVVFQKICIHFRYNGSIFIQFCRDYFQKKKISAWMRVYNLELEVKESY